MVRPHSVPRSGAVSTIYDVSPTTAASPKSMSHRHRLRLRISIAEQKATMVEDAEDALGPAPSGTVVPGSIGELNENPAVAELSKSELKWFVKAQKAFQSGAMCAPPHTAVPFWIRSP